MEYLRKLAILLLLSTLSLLPSSNAQADTKGRWKLLKRSIGVSAMHMQLLPNGKILVYDRTDAGSSNISLPGGKCIVRSSCNRAAACVNHTDCTAHSVEFDPSGRTVRPLTVVTETFCSSGALLPNGTLIQTGGNAGGDHAVRYFDPCDGCDWTEDVRGLTERRWYATNHILPDGRVIVVGGRNIFNYEFVPKLSDSDKAAYRLPFLWDTKDPSENNLYPFVHLSTDGNLFIFANTKSILLDYVNHSVVKYFPELDNGVSRNYPSTGSSVLLPLRLDYSYENATVVKAEVMICGGAYTTSFQYAANGTYLPASSSCGRLVITDESPSWELEEMPLPRVMGDMLLLPTADVLVINGASRGTAGWGNARDPVFAPVLYRTGLLTGGAARVFETMSPSNIPRVYHSTAHLIPDGRVLVAGSNAQVRYEFSGVLFPTELSVEAFFPPYLGRRRPIITSIAPNGVEFAYGDRLTIEFTMNGDRLGAADVHVTMIAPSFTTHSFSMNQRLLVLETEGLRCDRGEWYKLDAFAPASEVLAPPGYYMVFLVHGGVPSKGMWVRLR